MTHDTRYLKSDRMEEVKYIFVCNFKLKTLGFHIPVIKSKAYQDYHGLQFSQFISENSKAPGPYKGLCRTAPGMLQINTGWEMSWTKTEKLLAFSHSGKKTRRGRPH